MTRTLPTSVIDALDDNVVYPFFAIELNFDGADVLRLWTGIGTLNVQGVDWTGAGTLLNVSSIEETTEIAAKGATLSLTGIPSEVVSLALSTPYQGRTCKIYFGVSSTSMTEIFCGYMDQMDIEELPETSTIHLKVENKLVDLERARVARYSSSYQKSIYPTDFGLDLVESIQDKEIVWGRDSFKPSDATLNSIARNF